MAAPQCPSEPTPGELADWIELTALVEDWPVISRGRIHTSVDSSRASVEPEAIDTALRDIRRRAAWESSIYPFEKKGSTIRRVANRSPWPYMFLVLVSNANFVENVPRRDAGEIFERFCVMWAQHFLGERGRVTHFVSHSGDRPTRFSDAVQWLATELGLAPGVGYTPSSRNDGGVDIVAWLPFSDTKQTALVMLCQVTIQQDFVSKASDIDVRLWGNWIHFLVEPTRLLIVPHVVSNRDSDWTEVTDRGVALVDRRRLCETFGPADLELAAELDLRFWISQALDEPTLFA